MYQPHSWLHQTQVVRPPSLVAVALSPPRKLRLLSISSHHCIACVSCWILLTSGFEATAERTLYISLLFQMHQVT